MKTLGQGAATSLWAALKDGVKGGEYCIDCAIGVTKNPQADDAELPAKLWAKTEEQLGVIATEGKLLE